MMISIKRTLLWHCMLFCLGLSLLWSTRLLADAITPLRPLPSLSAARAALGKDLFHDLRLSADGRISCASCHPLAQGGSDNLPQSTGIGGAVGQVNAPTVYNAAYNCMQFWDGRAANLHEQAADPITNPAKMGSQWPALLQRLQQDRPLVARFQRLYPEEGLTQTSIIDALVNFEFSLITVDAPFDRWLQGDSGAMGTLALQGYYKFREFGCVSCHQGRLVGGNMFADMGTLHDYFRDRAEPPKESDLGRYRVTQNISDRYQFKVPSLRLAIKTPPYFHDGSSPTISDAVNKMAYYQLGRSLNSDDVEALVAFIASLQGKHELLN
ncbi:MAG: cytochrome B6 [Gammaproteobacteria bacterium]|nr:cytochrome B6 [Gammaproteobacteria bacterium]